ncbi:membrane-associated protein, putative [Bodo saltans]|uniref:Membrane-associated protein, putative n=1 Tax=Bodo saltans TaxID=75058 RepID=A0A0S4JCE2_BODSA|nr:membrane-associated protein, putative [Bodo saltans]|eukprot:CUG87158.1 membrane-associated protein, putative [Bodo saltans]
MLTQIASGFQIFPIELLTFFFFLFFSFLIQQELKKGCTLMRRAAMAREEHQYSILLLCLGRIAAAPISNQASSPTSMTLVLQATDAFCNSTDLTLNNCSDHIQSYIQKCSSMTSVRHCTIQFGPGTFYLKPSSFGPMSYVALYYFPELSGGLTTLTLSGAGAVSRSTSKVDSSISSGPTTLVLLQMVGFFYGAGAPQSMSSSGPVAPSISFYFSGFSLDVLRVPYSFGTAIGADTVRIAAAQVQSQTFALDTARWPDLTGALAVNTYSIDESRWTIGLDDYRLADPVILAYGAPDPNTGDVNVTLRTSAAGTPPPNLSSLLGQTIILRHQVYSLNGITLSYAALSASEVDFFSIGGMGIVCTRCYEIILDAFRVARPPNTTAGERPVSITADGIHVCNQKEGSQFVLTNSYIASQGDDCLNINAPMARIQSISADRRSIIATGYGGSAPPVSVGDVIQVLNRSTLAKTFATTTTEESNFSVSPDGNITLMGVGAIWPVGDVDVGDLIYASDAMTTTAIIQDNYFGQNRARGMLIRGKNFTVSNNVFDRNSGPSVLIVIDGCTFFEGPVLQSLLFLRNTIINPNLGPATSPGAFFTLGQTPEFTPSGVPVPNTCSTTSGSPAFYNFTVSQNLFVFNLTDPLLPTPTNSLYAEVVSGFSVMDNDVVRSNGVAGVSCEFTAVSCTQQSAVGNSCASFASSFRESVFSRVSKNRTGKMNVWSASPCATCGF